VNPTRCTLACAFAIVSVLSGCDWTKLETMVPKATSDAKKTVLVFVDTSKSVSDDDWQLYRQSYEAAVRALRPGDRLVLAPIHSHTWTNFAPSLDSTVPNLESEIDQDEAQVRQQQTAINAFSALQRISDNTQILDATKAAEQQFASAGDGERWLVVLSDMLEDSGDLKFDRQKLDSAAMNSLIDRRRKAGLLPRLEGVLVYVGGARAADATKMAEVQTFWEKYFAECGAKLAAYGRPALQFTGRS